MNVENRTIFEGDNLHILRGLDSETIDLIYLDPPVREHPEEPLQIRMESLFGIRTISELTLSQVQLRQFRSHKHTLFGIQEGKCNGCEVLFPFRNMTIDHITSRSKEGTDDPENL